MSATILEMPQTVDIQARLDRDGEVFLEVKKGEDGMYRAVFVDPEAMRELIGGVK